MPPESASITLSLLTEFRDSFPPNEVLISQAVEGALAECGRDATAIKNTFSRLVELVQADVYKNYLAAEAGAGSRAIGRVFGSMTDEKMSNLEAINLVASNFSALDRFFLSIFQGRKPRAGKVFESLIKELFQHLQYPFDPQAVINGQPDFLLPSKVYYQKNAMDCIIFTVKRTLRERWRQIVTEGTRGLGFFLATIDDDVSVRDLAEMLRSRIYLVMPARLVSKIPKYRGAANVISFEDFFRLHLDPAMERWRERGAI